MKADNHSIIKLAAAAVEADRQFSALCNGGASDSALGQQGNRHRKAMTSLAALASRSIGDLEAKGEALATAIIATPGEPLRLEGDYGLAASIVQDLRFLSSMDVRTIEPRGLPERLAAEYVGLSVSSMRASRARRDFPDPVTLTPGRVVYLRETLDAWLDRKAGRAPAAAVEDGSEWLIRAELPEVGVAARRVDRLRKANLRSSHRGKAEASK